MNSADEGVAPAADHADAQASALQPVRRRSREPSGFDAEQLQIGRAVGAGIAAEVVEGAGGGLDDMALG